MNLSAPFIRRPVMTTLIMSAILLAGVAAYTQLPVSDLPTVDFPTISVTAALPGASPETMASSVALPLERQFSTIAGLDSMSSTNTLGNTAITLQFNLDRNIDSAAQDVQTAIATASKQLPPDMPTPPSFQKVNPADQPILYVALTSATLPLSTLDELAQTRIAQRVSTVSGVAQVQVLGSQKYAVRAQLDPEKLAAQSLSMNDVAGAIRDGNVNLPTGVLDGPTQSFTVGATGQLEEASQFRKLVVAYRDGHPVRLESLGQIIDSVENDRTAAWYKDQRSIILAIQRQPGTNTVAVADAVKTLLPQIEKQLPAALSLQMLYDRSESIRASVSDVKMTLVLTLVLVVGVIFLFLRSARATIIPSLALPMSLIGTFGMMKVLGYSLDNLSLMALTLAVGFVVDDAIVMLENIVRHVEAGEGVLEAALTGSKEIVFTILSMTLSLTAVFIPVLFMGGIVGRLFHEFAVTIGVAILVSGFVSLSLTPLLCRLMLKPGQLHGGAHGGPGLVERAFDAAVGLYGRTLGWALRHRWVVLLVSLGVLGATIPLWQTIPKGFLSSEDTGQIVAFTQAAQGISFAQLAKHQQEAAEIVRNDPNVDRFMSSAGARGFTASNSGIIFIRLKPRKERLPVDEVIAELRPKLSKVVGLQVFLQNPPAIRIGGNLTKSPYQYTIQGADTDELYRAAPQLEAKMRALPGLVDVTSDLQLKNPQVTVRIDRDRAASLGVSPRAIEDTLYSAYGSRQISTIYAANNQYPVLIEVMPEFRDDPKVLSMLRIRSASGELVPLTELARIEQGVGPLSVAHQGQLPAVTISFNIAPGTSIGQAVSQVDALARQTLPSTLVTSFQGTAQAFQSSFEGLGWLLLAAILVIYLVLGILYESFIHPITILTALPFAGFGALVTLIVFHTELSLYAFVGIILLVGLVKKNGIMMVDFAIEEQKAGKPAAEAIHRACMVRFRPIMMTTLAALMGTLPIAIGIGAGAEARRPLGLAVVGGLLFSQLLTLYVTPVFFTYFDRLSRASKRRESVAHAETVVTAPPAET